MAMYVNIRSENVEKCKYLSFSLELSRVDVIDFLASRRITAAWQTCLLLHSSSIWNESRLQLNCCFSALIGGVVVNTCGYIRQEGYESFKHVAKTFDGKCRLISDGRSLTFCHCYSLVDIIVVLDSEWLTTKLISDLPSVKVIALPKSGGVCQLTEGEGWLTLSLSLLIRSCRKILPRISFGRIRFANTSTGPRITSVLTSSPSNSARSKSTRSAHHRSPTPVCPRDWWWRIPTIKSCPFHRVNLQSFSCALDSSLRCAQVARWSIMSCRLAVRSILSNCWRKISSVLLLCKCDDRTKECSLRVFVSSRQQVDTEKRTLTLLSPQPNIKNKLLIVSDILFVDMKWRFSLFLCVFKWINATSETKSFSVARRAIITLFFSSLFGFYFRSQLRPGSCVNMFLMTLFQANIEERNCVWSNSSPTFYPQTFEIKRDEGLSSLFSLSSILPRTVTTDWRCDQ